MKRREFIKATAVAAAATGVSARGAEQKRPNIIYIYTDQQSAEMMSCTGNKWLKTPAMDYMAENGIRFERAYTTNPVCSPARVSLMTGRFPDSFSNDSNVARENAGCMRIRGISEEVRQTTIASFMKKAGYELTYGGKVHLPKELHPASLGFNFITGDSRDGLAEKCADYIKQGHDKPYFLVASFINPHDICYMAIRDHESKSRLAKNRTAIHHKKLDAALKMPDGVDEKEFFAKHCPPLPKNYEPQKDEPKAVKSLLARRKFRIGARNNYSDKDWRRHRWAYHRLTEFVDAQIQVVLDALKESGQEENTVVILSSDHGDMSASHRMEHKTALYDESARIPFVVMYKGNIKGGVVDDEHLVSNGLDLLPTVCDFAGIKGKGDERGMSVKPLAEGKDVKWRKSLGVESEIGRMVVGDKCKYIKYDAEGIEEQLLDLKKDPHETRHFTNEKSHAKMLARMKKEYKYWFQGA